MGVYHSNDYTHRVKYESIYPRTDYITNTDPAPGLALLAPLARSMQTEPNRHPGLPQQDRGSVVTPIMLIRNRFGPLKKGS